MECSRAFYSHCDRLLTGFCVETTATTTALSSPSLSSSSSLPTSRRSYGNSSSSSSSCFGCRNARVSSPVVPWPSRHVFTLYLIWICMVVAVAAPEPPRSRSRSQFRFRTQRPVTPPPPQDTPLTTWPRSTPPQSLPSPSGSPTETVGGSGRRMPAAFTLPSRAPRSRSTTRLSKVLEYSDGQLPETSIRRPQTRSQSNILQRPSAEIIAGITVHSVPAAEFRLRLRSVRSYRDVIRMFVRSDERLRDEDIDDFLSAPSSPNSRSGDNESLPVNGHDRAMEHVFEMEEKGVCREPVAKFIQVRHHELASPASNYVPECTVVYRCHKDYGCCNSTSECGVKTSAYIYRTFWELTCDPGSNCTVFEFPKVKTLRFVNHTECECKQIKQLPRCKLCPQPFEVFRREEFGWCNCTCHPNNQVCLDTETGRIPVETQQANCIRESNCERPHCQHGEYDIQTGYCPCPQDNPDCRNTSQGQGNSTEADNSTTGELETAAHLETSTGQQNQTTNGQQVTTEQQQTTSEQPTASEQPTMNGQQTRNEQHSTNATESNSHV